MCAAIAVLSLSFNQAQAQFEPVPGSTNSSWRTHAAPTVGAIGIGTVPDFTSLPSALTIDGRFMPVATGEVFRTDAPNVSTFWRMYRDAQQRFLVNSADNTNSETGLTEGTVRLGSTQGEHLSLLTNSATRMHIAGYGYNIHGGFPPNPVTTFPVTAGNYWYWYPPSDLPIADWRDHRSCRRVSGLDANRHVLQS